MKKFFLFAGIFLLVLGQLVFLKFDFPGLVLSGAGCILIIIFFIAFKVLALKELFKYMGVILFFLFSVSGVYYAGSNGSLALVLFVLAGVSLLANAGSLKEITAVTELKSSEEERKKWEIYFLAALIVILFFTRLFMPGQFPAGFTGHESEMSMECQKMEGQYTAHSFAHNVSFPSLIFYQGIMFSKIFGFEPGSLRMPSGVWGIVGIIAFYFLARTLFSARAAAFAALLFAASNLHIVQSRWLYPGTILIPPILAGFAFLIYGIRKNKWYYFLLAGLAAGFTSHGYFPGRGAPLIFVFWFLAAFVIWRKYSLNLKKFLLFTAGFVIISLPIIFFIMKHPNVYFGYFDHANPNRSAGIERYVDTAVKVVPQYAKMFHVRGDYDYSIHIEHSPLLDPVTGLFFPAAFFISVLLFFRPVPAFILLVFFAGMMPAFLGGGFEHPTQRRIIMALPAIYLFAAMAFELINRRLRGTFGKAFFVTAIASAVFAVGFSAKKFFIDYCGSPYEAIGYAKMFKEGGDFLRENKNDRLIATPLLRGDVAHAVLIPHEENIEYVWSYEEIFFTREDTDLSAALGGYFEYARGAVESVFDEISFDVVKEQQCHYPITKKEFFTRKTEPFSECTYITKLRIPAESYERARGMAVLQGSDTGIGTGSTAFLDENRGKSIVLTGSFFTKGGKVRVELPYEGWSVKVNGKKIEPGRELSLVYGAHQLDISGKVPTDVSGRLPAAVFEDSKPVNLFKIKEPYGLYACHTAGYNTEKTECVREYNYFFPVRRYYNNIPGMNLPETVFYSGYIRVPESGEYMFGKNMWNSRMKIEIDGKTIYDSMRISHIVDTEESIVLEAGEKYPFKAVYVIEGNMAMRGFVPYYSKRGGGPGRKIVPAEWFLRF